MGFRSPIRTVGVSGTVTTTGSGSTPTAPTLAQRAFTNGSGQSSVTVAAPADLAVGDLMIFVVGDANGTGTFATPTGWTRLGGWGISGNSTPGKCAIFTKVAASADLGANAVLTDSGGATIQGTRTAISGGLTTGARLDGSSITQSSWAPSTGLRTSGQALMVVTCAPRPFGGTAPANPAWQAAGSGGPPTPQPTWNGGAGALGSVVNGVWSSLTNWPTAQYTFTQAAGSAVSSWGFFLLY